MMKPIWMPIICVDLDKLLYKDKITFLLNRARGEYNKFCKREKTLTC